MTRRVYLWHFRALEYCNRGMRRWFASRGIAWQDVLNDGVDAELLLASGDAMAIAAVEFAASTGWTREPIAGDAAAKRGGCV